ncbi:hypothetical protein [Deinococcus sp.]|uniref:hypothetical protein n=1 Tax=Deinococcus sp. TaxID=47478 RepID=UPI003CC5758D
MAHEPNAQLAALFPELRDWNEGKGITVSDWMNTIGNIPAAIAYSTLFWPEFVEYESCIFWSNFSPNSFDAWMKMLNGNKTRVEAVINHRHITDFFLNAEEKPSLEQIEYLGELLRKIWTLKLQNDFPLSDVRVEFYWNDREATDDAQITVYCQRETS